MVIFTKRQWRIFNRMRRKYKVSLEFLNYNLPNILKFIAYYARRLHFVLRRSAERSRNNRTVVIKYNRLMRLLFDESYRKRIKRRKKNVKQWSKRMVLYLRKTQGVKEYTMIKKLRNLPQKTIKPEEVIKQLKEQLELLKSGKRSTQLIDCSLSENEMKSGNSSLELTTTPIKVTAKKPPDAVITIEEEPMGELILNEKTGILENVIVRKVYELNKPNRAPIVPETKSAKPNAKSSSNILDLLMSKVSASTVSAKAVSNSLNTSENDTGVDSGEEFLGFAEDENIPGLMRTPLVPSIVRSNVDNAVFVSESLDEYFRENSLNKSSDAKELVSLYSNPKLRQANIDGLMTLSCIPPAFTMPSVPESLQKLRTVAERRNFLQKFSKNFKLSIINNEAAVYREFQRKIRQPKTKISSQIAMQANNSQMSFSRQGWQAASFVTTELNRFFFQKLFLLDEKETVELRGVRGNNVQQFKAPYTSRITFPNGYKRCTANCIDCHIAKCLKPISTFATKKKLCKQPFRSIFKACPLSKKPHQPLLDVDDAVEILLSGGGMAVVRVPTVELQVCPELGKPLNDIAKRYLEHIIPYEEITREWAEFSTSTLQLATVRSKSSANMRKSYAFTVPYVNDRSHILVRRKVDRTEKVDSYFLGASGETSWSGLSFCANIDKSDKTQVECASILADMINAVAISCSENSFSKEDSDSLHLAQNPSHILPQEKLLKRKNSAVAQKTTTVAKKSRLISELRRLNATIIETNAQHKDVSQCLKEFCALGCICPSLSNGYPLQQHCGKPKCMLQCVCKGSSPSQILRIETDGRSITTEDAYNMRRQATARLARMEKEFTSTVVVTENETLLINETQYEKKRRCTKVPKRYEDYRDTDNEFGRISPVKSCSTPLTDANESRSSPATTISEVMSDLQDPIYIKDITLKQLKHCSIPLVPFTDIQNMAVWCMVHHMYKCFCGGHALEGKRLLLEKEDSKAVSGDKNIGSKTNFASKAYYSFESSEDSSMQSVVPTSSPKKQILKNNNTVDVETTSTNDIKTVKYEKPKHLQSPTTQINCDFLKKYFTGREYLGCSRFIPVPSRTYRSINQKRRQQILDNIEYIDQDKKSQLLLNEHIMRSVYYHKEKPEEKTTAMENAEPTESIKMEEFKCSEENSSMSSETVEPEARNEEQAVDVQKQVNSITVPDRNSNPHATKAEHLKRTLLLLQEELQLEQKKIKRNSKNEGTVPLLNEEIRKEQKFPEKSFSNPHATKAENSKRTLIPPEEELQVEQTKVKLNSKIGANVPQLNEEIKKEQKCPEKSYLNPHATKVENLKRSLMPSEEELQLEQKKVKRNRKIEGTFPQLNEETMKEQPVVADDMQVPKISGLFSLQSQNKCSNEKNYRGNQISMAQSSGLPTYPDGVRENYNEVIRMLNSLVSRKMHDIDNALKRDSKIVPPPTENVLCVLQWKNFLGAFHDGLIYIWEVRMKTRTFLAATITNMIPMVLGALAVISITQTPLQRLPLIGRLILQGVSLDESLNLAVIMQGRLHYWRIKGFLQPNTANACLRPTPETHPELTKKINTLCSSLIKQRTREMERREALMQQKAKSSNKNELLQQHKQENAPRNGLQAPIDNLISTPDQQVQKSQIQTTATTREQNKALSSLKLNQTKWTSNIQLKKRNSLDMEGFQIPEVHASDHSWYILDLCNDFSHIFVPVQKEIVSLDRIQRLLTLSVKMKKVIRIQFLKRRHFDAFIVPTSECKIYFGPFPLDAEPPLLVLLQSVDGKMMTRETYQYVHKIPTKSKQTTAFWLKQISGRICFEKDNVESNEVENNKNRVQASPTQMESSTAPDEDYDDDCFIVEVHAKSSEMPTKLQPSKQIKEVKSLATQPSTHTSCTTVPELPATLKTKNNKTATTTGSHTNFVFQSSNERNGLEVIPAFGSNDYKNVAQMAETIKKEETPKNTNSKTTLLPSKQIKEVKLMKTQPSTYTSSTKAFIELELQKNKTASTTESHTNFIFQSANEKSGLEVIPALGSYDNKNVVETAETLENVLVSQQKEEERSKMLPIHSTKTEPVLLNNKLNFVNSINPAQIGVRKSNSATLTKPSPTIISKKFVKLINNPQHSIVDHSIADNELNRKIFLTNRPTTAVATSINKNYNPTSTSVSSCKLLKAALSNTAPITIQSTSCSISTASNVNTTSYTSTQPTTSTMQQTTIKKTPDNNLKCNKISRTSTPEVSTATLAPQAVKRLASGIIKIPLNPINTTKTTTIPTTSVAASQNSSPTLEKLIKKPTTTTVRSQEIATFTKTSESTTSTPTFYEKSVDDKRIRLAIHPENKSIPTGTATPNTTTFSVSLNAKHDDINTNNSSQASASHKTPNNPTPTPTQIEYITGFFYSNMPGMPRFLSKRLQSVYLIKIPDRGLVKITGIIRANAYLNQQIARIYPSKIPTNQKLLWTFVPHKSNNNTQNKGNNVQKTVPFPSNPITEKGKIITPPNVNLDLIPRFKHTAIAKQSRQLKQNSSMSSEYMNIVGETILIDD